MRRMRESDFWDSRSRERVRSVGKKAKENTTTKIIFSFTVFAAAFLMNHKVMML